LAFASIVLAQTFLIESSFDAVISPRYTSPQSRARASCNAENPNPPNPKIATDSSDLSRALFKACKTVADEHIMIAPTSNEISSGSVNAFRAGTLMNSAYPPSRCRPIICPLMQNCSNPRTQNSQEPQCTK